jgi:hypothetical protein
MFALHGCAWLVFCFSIHVLACQVRAVARWISIAVLVFPISYEVE